MQTRPLGAHFGIHMMGHLKQTPYSHPTLVQKSIRSINHTDDGYCFNKWTLTGPNIYGHCSAVGLWMNICVLHCTITVYCVYCD